MLRSWLGAAVLAVGYTAACTGDDPVPLGSGGTSGTGTTSDAGTSGGTSGTPAVVLELEGQPSTVTVGTTGVVQFSVKNRQNVGEVSFRVTKKPDGVNAVPEPLRADATTLNVNIEVDASAKHGDYAIEVEATGGVTLTATAPLIVRGKSGAVDTGFGIDGTFSSRIEFAAKQKVVPLADGRLVIGQARDDLAQLYFVDRMGLNATPSNLVKTTNVRFVDVAPTEDGGFVMLAKEKTSPFAERLVWYSSEGVEDPTTVTLPASALNLRVGRIAATPKGTIYAQAESASAFVIHRFAKGIEDATFASVRIEKGDVDDLRFLVGRPDGGAWLHYVHSLSVRELAVVEGDGRITTRSLPDTTCSYGASLGADLVTRCVSGVPNALTERFTLRPDHQIAKPSGWAVDELSSTSSASARLDRLIAGPHVYAGVAADSYELRVLSFDENNQKRTVFGEVMITSDYSLPEIVVDARGRLVAVVEDEHVSTRVVQFRRFWD